MHKGEREAVVVNKRRGRGSGGVRQARTDIADEVIRHAEY